jgi:multidrug efflux pump subunit AcrA (membrane-fusion protein)
LWAAFAPLDEGVPTHGMVTLDTKRKAVQHLSGGIVKEVLVQEGEKVKEGQPLVRLDAAVARSNYESVRQRYLGFRAMQSRLFAEQAGRDLIDFPSRRQRRHGRSFDSSNKLSLSSSLFKPEEPHWQLICKVLKKAFKD